MPPLSVEKNVAPDNIIGSNLETFLLVVYVNILAILRFCKFVAISYNFANESR